MGIFSKKQKHKKEDMPILMMAIGIDMIGKLNGFNDIDDNYTMAVNLGYFYGFLRIQLCNLTDIQTADKIIEDSLLNLNETVNNKIELNNFMYIVKTNFNNAFANIKKATTTNNIITSISQLYLYDLYQKEISDDVKLLVAKNNIKLLYEMISKLTNNIKII